MDTIAPEDLTDLQQAQQTLYDLLVTPTGLALTGAQAVLTNTKKRIAEKYGLHNPQDGIDLRTGAITRAVVAPAADPKSNGKGPKDFQQVEVVGAVKSDPTPWQTPVPTLGADQGIPV